MQTSFGYGVYYEGKHLMAQPEGSIEYNRDIGYIQCMVSIYNFFKFCFRSANFGWYWKC